MKLRGCFQNNSSVRSERYSPSNALSICTVEAEDKNSPFKIDGQVRTLLSSSEQRSATMGDWDVRLPE
jgi:hypothetical protein